MSKDYRAHPCHQIGNDPMTHQPDTDCLSCATDVSPGGMVWTRTSVLIATLRRFADDAEQACCVHEVARGLREHADELAVLVEASHAITKAADGPTNDHPRPGNGNGIEKDASA